jgi:ribonuclease III
VCEYLYHRYPDLLEGELTKIKSAAVSRRSCANVARALGLDELLITGKGMGGPCDLPKSLSAAVLETLIAAIYLDGGFEPAREFILRNMTDPIESAASSGHHENFKSVLQQHAQRRFGYSASYILLDEKGPDHAKCFEICVEINGRRFPACWCPSKKQAEQRAALNALLELGVARIDDDSEEPYLVDEEQLAERLLGESPD